MLLHASTSTSEWISLDITTVSGASDDEVKKAQTIAESARQKLADYLRTVLTTPNLLVLAGSGTSLGKAGGLSMQDLWAEAARIQGFGEVVSAVKHSENDEWIENLLVQHKIICG